MPRMHAAASLSGMCVCVCVCIHMCMYVLLSLSACPYTYIYTYLDSGFESVHTRLWGHAEVDVVPLEGLDLDQHLVLSV